MPNGDPIMAYGYARASSPKCLGTQGSKYSKQELSPHRQAELIEKRGWEICEEHGATWSKCYMEWASAVKLKYNERPVFQELMKVIQPRDHLVIWRVDRLGGEFFGSMACLEWLQNRRIVIHSIEEFGAVPIDLNSALGRVMVALLAGAKDLTNEHSRKAIAQALDWHRRYGPTPIGKRRIEVARGSKIYKVDVYDEDDLEVIREIAARRAMNDGWAEIGRELERRHLTLHDGRPWVPRRKRGKYKGCLVQETMERGLKGYLEHVEERGEPKGFTKTTAYLEAQRIVGQILGDRDAAAVDQSVVPATPFIPS